jgi:hypothetical protein
MDVAMHRLRSVLPVFRRLRAGQGLVEYALILVLAVVVVVTALASIGHQNPGGNPMQSVAETLDETT